VNKYYKLSIYILATIVFYGVYTSARVAYILENEDTMMTIQYHLEPTEETIKMETALWKAMWQTPNFLFQDIRIYYRTYPAHDIHHPTWGVSIMYWAPPNSLTFNGVYFHIHAESGVIVHRGTMVLNLTPAPQ